MTVAALYVDPRGPYYLMPDVEPWGLPDRDARDYAGPWPVVAHPPCGPWGKLAHFCTKQDATLAPLAAEQVRKWGGVLEHPEESRLWKHCGLPAPVDPMAAQLVIPTVDRWGGVSIVVDQCRWGHRARKRTWLYLVRCAPWGKAPEWREPTRFPSGNMPTQNMDAQERRLTPPAFAEWLVEIAKNQSNYG